MRLKIAATIAILTVYAVTAVDWSLVSEYVELPFAVEAEDDDGGELQLQEPTAGYAAIARNIEMAIRDDLRSQSYSPDVALQYAEFFAGCSSVFARSPERLRTLAGFSAFKQSAGFLHFADLGTPCPELRKAYDAAARQVWGANGDGTIDDRQLKDEAAEKLVGLLEAASWGCYQASLDKGTEL